jgi:hypothetical protein
MSFKLSKQTLQQQGMNHYMSFYEEMHTLSGVFRIRPPKSKGLLFPFDERTLTWLKRKVVPSCLSIIVFLLYTSYIWNGMPVPVPSSSPWNHISILTLFFRLAKRRLWLNLILLWIDSKRKYHLVANGDFWEFWHLFRLHQKSELASAR